MMTKASDMARKPFFGIFCGNFVMFFVGFLHNIFRKNAGKGGF